MKHKKAVLWIACAGAVLLLVAGLLWGLGSNSVSELPKEQMETVSILTIGEISPEALTRVSNAISEITMERLNCRVELRVISPDEYDERIDNLLLESDFADIFVCRNRTTMNKLMAGNYIYRLDRYLGRRAGLRTAISDQKAWDQVTKQGYIYGIPFCNQSESAWGFLMRKDICDELNIGADSVTTLEELYQVLLRVKKAYPDIVPVVSNYSEMETFSAKDLLISGGGSVIANEEVVSIYDLPEFEKRCAMMAQWNDEGLILQNASQNRAGRAAWISNGMAFGSFAGLNRYTARELEYAAGVPIECAVLEDVFYNDNSSMSFAVYAYTEEVDLSLRVLELIYTDQEVLRLCVYGQEGIDYTLSDSGAIVPVDGCQYFNNCWPFRDTLPAPISIEDPEWYGESDKIRDGFFFDNGDVAGEIYQCGETLEKYFEVLCAGGIDPHEGINRMETELGTANTETVQREFKKQWDMWQALS